MNRVMSIFKITVILVCFMGYGINVYAINYPLISDKALPIRVAKQGYTRFLIEDERITDVFVYPQEAVQVMIHNQGYLVIVPGINQQDQTDNEGKAIKQESIYLTITGEQGTTQDIRLNFTGKTPEPVKFIKLDLGNNKENKNV